MVVWFDGLSVITEGTQSPVWYDGLPVTRGSAAPGVPVVDAGPDQSIISGAPATVTLAGSATDPDPLTYLWTVISKPLGSTVVFVNDTAPGTNVDLSHLGSYVLQLAANDGVNTGTDTMTITVSLSSGFNALMIMP